MELQCSQVCIYLRLYRPDDVADNHVDANACQGDTPLKNTHTYSFILYFQQGTNANLK